MIRILITILLLCLAALANAQCYDPNWDWEKPEEWIIHYRDGKQNYSPFNKNRASSDIRRIIDNDSLKKSEGWVLLYKNLGCDAIPVEQPRVIFYNKFRSIIRVMAIHRRGPKASSGLLEVEWGSGATGRSSLLTPSNIYSYPNSSYPNRSGDRVVNTIESYVSADDAWWVSDFQVAFDHTTNSSQRSAYLTFRSYNIVDSNLEIEGVIDLTSKSIDLKGANKAGTDGDKQNWGVKGVKVVQSLKPGDWDDYLTKASKVFEGISKVAVKKWDKNKAWASVGSATALLARATKGEGKLGKVLSTVAEGAGFIGSAVGIAADLFGFSGKTASAPSPVEITPFVTTGTISQKGFIKTQTDEESYTLDLPGIQPDQFTYYTCPLGVLNLENEIKVDKRTWKERKNILTNFQIGEIDADGHISQLPGKATENALTFSIRREGLGNRNLYFKEEKWKSIKLKENLKLSINSASELELVSAVIALHGQVKSRSENDKTGAYNVFEEYEFLPKLYTENLGLKTAMRTREKRITYKGRASTTTYPEFSLKNRWINKTFNYLNSGIYKMINGGETLEEGGVNTLYKFRTGYVDLNRAKNLTMTIRDETVVTLKVIALLRKKGDKNAPLVTLTKEYMVNEPTVASDDLKKAYPFIRDQIKERIDVSESESRIVLRNRRFRFEAKTICPLKKMCYPSYRSVLDEKYTYPSGVYFGNNSQLETLGRLDVIAKESVQFQSLNSVTLKPGFHARAFKDTKGSFTAKIVDDPATIIPTTVTPLTNLVKYYKDGKAYTTPQKCDCSPNTAKKRQNSNRREDTINSEITNNFTVYPNPGKDQITISYRTESKRPRKLLITNIDGRAVLEFSLTANTKQLDISNLNSGVYILILFDEGTQMVKKFVKK